jgi:hypothetical protein
LVGWRFALRALQLQSRCSTTEPHLQSILLWLFWRWSSWTVCLGWPRTKILLISASQVARITGVSHQCLAFFFFLWWWGYWAADSQPFCCCILFLSSSLTMPELALDSPSSCLHLPSSWN